MNRPKNKILKQSAIFRLAEPLCNQFFAFSPPLTVVLFRANHIGTRTKAGAMVSSILDGLNQLDFQIGYCQRFQHQPILSAVVDTGWLSQHLLQP